MNILLKFYLIIILIFSYRMESFWVQTAIGAIKAIAFVCDIITLPVYLVLQKPWKRRQLSRRAKVIINYNLNCQKIKLTLCKKKKKLYNLYKI